VKGYEIRWMDDVHGDMKCGVEILKDDQFYHYQAFDDLSAGWEHYIMKINFYAQFANGECVTLIKEKE